jgi:hypothetical protein
MAKAFAAKAHASCNEAVHAAFARMRDALRAHQTLEPQ